MGFRSPRCSWVKFSLPLLFLPATAGALTVKPVTPYSLGTGDKVFYAYAPIIAPGFVDTAAGFRAYDTSVGAGNTNREQLVVFEITSASSLGPSSVIGVRVLAENNTDKLWVPIAAAGVSPSATPENCTSTTCSGEVGAGLYYYSARYATSGTTVRIALYPRDICRLAVGSSTTSSTYVHAKGCTAAGGEVDNPAGNSPAITTLTVDFVAGAPDAQGFVDMAGSPDSKNTVSLIFSSTPPTLQCNSPGEFYFPGDSSIQVNPLAVAGSPGVSGGPGAGGIFIVAKEGSTPDMTAGGYVNNGIYAAVASNQGTTLPGFTNTTTSSDHPYFMNIAARDDAGIIGAFNTDTSAAGCAFTQVRTSAVQGFMSQNACFIATAAFRELRSAPVDLLREFRDRILLRHRPGRAFVRWYYDHSPRLATWLVDHPKFRFPVMLMLVPFEVMAWLVLNPLVLWAGIALMFAVFMASLVGMARGRRGTSA
ncbi:MAG: CFI-box-CTERM domain-containing protein [Bacteriovoracia bacterium]